MPSRASPSAIRAEPMMPPCSNRIVYCIWEVEAQDLSGQTTSTCGPVAEPLLHLHS